MTRPRVIFPLSLLALALGGCAPMVPMGGAYFPAWLLSAVCGLVLAALTRGLFVWRGWEASIEPRFLVYPALAVFYTLAVYWLFFP